MTSLSRRARVAGLLYLLVSAVGVVRLLYIPGKLFVHGNAAATAGNILAHEPLFRLGIATNLVAGVAWLFVTFALYRLLEGVDRGLAVVMVIVGGVMQTPVYVAGTALDAAALQLLHGDALSGFAAAQGQATALLLLRVHSELQMAAQVFSGLWLLPLGLLIYRSRFLPRLLGAWLMLACFGWLAVCFSGLLFPADSDRVFTLVQPLTLGELALMLWLLIAGAREPETAAATPAPPLASATG